MRIYTNKEVINKTIEDIPELVQLIKTKEDEIKKLLTQESVENPLELKGKAHNVFQAIRKEILATLNILEKLGYTGTTGKEWKMLNSGPFFTFDPLDLSSPKVSREIKKLEKQQEEILKSAEVNINDLRQITFDI